MNDLLISNEYFPLIAVVIIAIIITVIIILSAKILSQNRVRYEKKDCLLTELEKRYYREFCEIFGDRFIVLPQINLATVIDKVSPGFRTELFRNVDFGVFDHNLTPILLIEINDPSHNRDDRIARDENVKKICKKAGLPLITFWTKDGINRQVMLYEFRKYVKYL